MVFMFVLDASVLMVFYNLGCRVDSKGRGVRTMFHEEKEYFEFGEGKQIYVQIHPW